MDKISPKQRTLVGTVASAKMMKTVVVSVERLKLHPKYKKRYRVTTRFKAHVQDGTYVEGDRVLIGETRPLSKDKRWEVLQKL